VNHPRRLRRAENPAVNDQRSAARQGLDRCADVRRRDAAAAADDLRALLVADQRLKESNYASSQLIRTDEKRDRCAQSS
jgi:hypothetical protein